MEGHPRRRACHCLLLLCSLIFLLLPIDGFLHCHPPQASSHKHALGHSNVASRGRLAVMPLYAKKNRNKKGGKRREEQEEEEGIDDTAAALNKLVVEDAPPSNADDEDVISPNMYDKLKSEVTTPFRSFRLFLYVGFGAGAGIGGLTALTQLAASIAGKEGSIPLTQAIQNVGVDFAVLAAAIFAWKFESDLRKVTEKEMAEQRAREPYKLTPDVKLEREKTLSSLQVEVLIGNNVTRPATLREVRERGQQHVIVVAGSKKFIGDCLLGARLTKPIGVFSKNKVVIVPIIIKDPMDEVLPPQLGEKKGFGSAPTFDVNLLMTNEPYITRVEDEASWMPYIETEFSDAEKQGNPNARKMGIGIVMNQEGKIIRRGVGMPEWRDVIEELVGAKKINEFNDAFQPEFPSLRNKK